MAQLSTRAPTMVEVNANLLRMLKDHVFLSVEAVVPIYRDKFGPLDIPRLLEGVYNRATLSNLLSHFQKYTANFPGGLRLVTVRGQNNGSRTFLGRGPYREERALENFQERLHVLLPPGTLITLDTLQDLYEEAFPEDKRDAGYFADRMNRWHAKCCQRAGNDSWKVNLSLQAERERSPPLHTWDYSSAAPGGYAYGPQRDQRGEEPEQTVRKRRRSRSPPGSRSESRDRAPPKRMRSRSRSPPLFQPRPEVCRSPELRKVYDNVWAIMARYCFLKLKDLLPVYKRHFGFLDYKSMLSFMPNPHLGNLMEHFGATFPGGIKVVTVTNDPRAPRNVANGAVISFVGRDFTTQEIDLATFVDQVHALVPPRTDATVESLWELYCRLWQNQIKGGISDFRWQMEQEHSRCCRLVNEGKTWLVNVEGREKEIVVDTGVTAMAAESTLESERKVMLEKALDPRLPKFRISEAEVLLRLQNVLKLFDQTYFLDEDSFKDVYEQELGEPLDLDVFDISVKYPMSYLKQLSLRHPGKISVVFVPPKGEVQKHHVLVRRIYGEGPVDPGLSPIERIHRILPRGTTMPLTVIMRLYKQLWPKELEEEDEPRFLAALEREHRDCCLASKREMRIRGKDWKSYLDGPEGPVPRRALVRVAPAPSRDSLDRSSAAAAGRHERNSSRVSTPRDSPPPRAAAAPPRRRESAAATPNHSPPRHSPPRQSPPRRDSSARSRELSPVGQQKISVHERSQITVHERARISVQERAGSGTISRENGIMGPPGGMSPGQESTHSGSAITLQAVRSPPPQGPREASPTLVMGAGSLSPVVEVDLIEAVPPYLLTPCGWTAPPDTSSAHAMDLGRMWLLAHITGPAVHLEEFEQLLHGL
ncbi:hypothetical protein DFJ74DRAFT_516516 [Hyaloraphidium curvatum]|nr:hypothetical protein DFJ74DRAFT_516516 [Hyaloraphidium curvatum]